MYLDLDISEKMAVLDQFYDKLVGSGHKHKEIQSIFIEGLLKFNKMVENSKLSPDSPDFKPLYLSNDYNKVERGISKFLRKYNWHDPTWHDFKFRQFMEKGDPN